MGNKKWYLLRGVEYSTDLNFFIEEQIFLHSLTKQMMSDNDLKKPVGKFIKTEKVRRNEYDKSSPKDFTKYYVKTYTVGSRLEKFNFDGVYSGDEEYMNNALSLIHSKLMNGLYGEGVFVD